MSRLSGTLAFAAAKCVRCDLAGMKHAGREAAFKVHSQGRLPGEEIWSMVAHQEPDAFAFIRQQLHVWQDISNFKGLQVWRYCKRRSGRSWTRHAQRGFRCSMTTRHSLPVGGVLTPVHTMRPLQSYILPEPRSAGRSKIGAWGALRVLTFALVPCWHQHASPHASSIMRIVDVTR